MTPEEEQLLLKIHYAPDYSVEVYPFIGGKYRTLFYGYDCDRKTWHCYLNNCKINLHVYDGVSGETINRWGRSRWDDAHLLFPNKRLYPETCDFGFFNHLMAKGVRPTTRTAFGVLGKGSIDLMLKTGFYGLL